MVTAIRQYLESLTDSSEAIGDDEARKEYDTDARKALELFVTSEATAV